MAEAAARAPTDASVVIVGAGPVGMTLANLLGTYGVRTLVLERNAELFDHPRAVGTDADSLRAWQAAGLSDRLLEDMTPMGPSGLGMVYVDAARRPFMEVRPASREAGFAYGYGLVQPRVDRVLLDGLGRFEHVETRFGHRVLGIEQYADHVIVRGRRIGGRPFAVQAAFAVACDGGGSGVRRQLGIRMRGSSYRRRWLVLDTLVRSAADAPPQDVEICCDPRRPSVSVPRRFGHRRFEFLQRPDETISELESPETIRALLSRYVDPDDVEIVRRATHAFSARIAERFRAGRILLAGDAAHVTPPFAAQGLACGIRDAFNLAWKLALVVGGGAQDALLDSYETERSAHDRASVRLAVRLGWLMMPGSRPSARLSQGAIRGLLRLPSLRRWVREAGPRPDIHYRRGFLRRGGRSAGRALPQPLVRDREGRKRPLDEVLGDGFALLGFDVDPAEFVPIRDREPWLRLGTRILRVRPAGQPLEHASDVCDLEGGFGGPWAALWGRCVLVRPDRVVALEAEPRLLPAALRSLESQLLHPGPA